MISFFRRQYEYLEVDTAASRLTFIPPSLIDLHNEPPYQAALKLRKTLDQIVLPQEEHCNYLERIIGTIKAHISIRYPDDQSYRQEINYGTEPPPVKAVCLTGLSGVGKTSFIKSLARILPSEVIFDPKCGIGKVKTKSMWYFDAGETKGILQLLREHLGGQKFDSPAAIRYCQKKAHREGVSLIVVDEIQFGAGSSSCAAISKILLSLTRLGIPMIIVTNFSAVRKLLSRPPEYRRRLLDSPALLLPDNPDNTCWKNYIHTCLETGNLETDISLSRLTDEIYELTAGIRGYASQLISEAYISSRKHNPGTLKVSNIVEAYTSVAFSAARRDIEYLFKYDITKKGPDLDMHYPLDTPKERAEALILALEHRRREAANAIALAASLNATERQTKSVEVRAMTPHKKPTPPKKRRTELNIEDLKNNYNSSPSMKIRK
ncbi:ATP-binding protein [Pseudomonas putida]